MRRAAVEGYVHDRTTYSRLGKRWRVNRSTAYRWVQHALTRRNTLLDRTKKNISKCDGIVVLDGKHVNINGVLHTIFVAWDRRFGKPIHFVLRKGGEGDIGYWKLMIDLRHVGYEPNGFISDGILSLKEFLADMYSNLPHQRCTVHVFLSARGKVAPGRRTPERTRDFIELLKRILWSQTLGAARKKLKKVWDVPHLSPRERRVLEFVWPTLTQCFVCRDPRWKHLNLPRSSNAIENVIGQIEARLKTMRGQKSAVSANLLINEILLRVRRQIINQ